MDGPAATHMEFRYVDASRAAPESPHCNLKLPMSNV